MKHRVPAQSWRSHPSGNPGEAWFAAMSAGDFEAAWAVNDWVLAQRHPAGRDDPAQPYHLRWVWDGRRFDGCDVLVRCYHGLGDTLQFCRYLAPLRDRVRSVSLEVQPALLKLLAGLPGPDRLLPFRPETPSPPSDCDLEIMELAHALRLRPDGGAYLQAALATADPGSIEPGQDGVLRVGLCWHVNPSWAPERAVPLRLLACLADVPGVRLYSLQRGAGAEQLAEPGAPLVANEGDDSTAVLDTARLIRGLDLVVSVDTMVAHLAGGLGVPVWLLLPAEPDWRWRAGGRGSPWYSGVRKYQQLTPGDWSEPVEQLGRDLTRMAERKRVFGT